MEMYMFFPLHKNPSVAGFALNFENKIPDFSLRLDGLPDTAATSKYWHF